MRAAINVIAIALASFSTAGCLTVADWVSDQDLSAPGRGRDFARTECSGCHAIGATGVSPRAGAPNFGTIRMRHNELSLERELQAIEEVGHYSMPPMPISRSGREDLKAYIESLGQ